MHLPSLEAVSEVAVVLHSAVDLEVMLPIHLSKAMAILHLFHFVVAVVLFCTEKEIGCVAAAICTILLPEMFAVVAIFQRMTKQLSSLQKWLLAQCLHVAKEIGIVLNVNLYAPLFLFPIELNSHFYFFIFVDELCL